MSMVNNPGVSYSKPGLVCSKTSGTKSNIDPDRIGFVKKYFQAYKRHFTSS